MLFASLAVVGVVSLLAFAIPLFMPDGSQKYLGIKQEAGKTAIQYAWSSHSGIDGISIIGTLKVTAEDVTTRNPDSGSHCNEVFYSTEEPDASDMYTVKLSFRTLFGVELKKGVAYVCRSRAE